MSSDPHIPPILPSIDAASAAKASFGSSLATAAFAALSLDVIVYLSFFVGLVAGIYSILRHRQDARRSAARERRESEQHAARMAEAAAREERAAAIHAARMAALVADPNCPRPGVLDTDFGGITP